MSKHSVYRINSIITKMGFSSYLEVGVNKGETFTSVNANRKVAVDPKFNFEFHERANLYSTSERYFEITSDEFFYQNSEKFDIIFLDGLHTFEQTFRDFCNSISLANDNTIILIDDTLPTDIYSAHPNQSEAIKIRQKDTQKVSGSWHGDVFKTIFAIREYFPLWSYRTITSGGNPQTVVFRKCERRDSRGSSLETISRMSYFDLWNNYELLNPTDVWDEIINIL
jgi:hypothetical protein